jgi:ABC-type phosphate/phosphonate transport system permease subunit
MKIQQLLLLALLVAPYAMALDFGANIRGGLAENMKSVNSESIGVDVQQRALGSYSSGKGKVSFGIMIVLSMSATSSLIGSLVYIPLISF